MNNEASAKTKLNKSIRDGFGEALVEVGEKNQNVIALTADLAESTRVDSFAKKFPERFFQVGVAEQNLVTVAAGMALAGKIPFVTSYAVFSPGRTFEQIKITTALQELPVKIIGAHIGFGASMYGATHQSFEDIALMRVIPNMEVIVPCDWQEAKKATIAISNNSKPTYLRLERPETELITKPEDKFEIGKANIVHEGKDPQVTIVGCGSILVEALSAAKELSNIGIETVVINMHTIKPIDDVTLTRYAKLTDAFVTVEEHQVAGGLGSAVAEVLSQTHPAPIEFIGMENSFSETAKTYQELRQKFGLTKENIIEKVKRVITRKNS